MNPFAGPCWNLQIDKGTGRNGMRLLYFSRDYTTHDRHFLHKLTRTEHEVHYLRLEDDEVRYEKRPLPPGVHLVEWPGGRGNAGRPEDWMRLLAPLQDALDRVKPDLVQAGPVQSCALMTAILGFHPLLTVSWGSDILVDADRDDFWRWMTRYTLERSDMLLCDSLTVLEKVQQIGKYRSEDAVVFPWGVDLKEFSPGPDTLGLRERLGWQDCFVVLSTRAWNPRYGVEVLIDAFRIAHSNSPTLRLMLLGTGTLAADVRRLITSHALDDVVHYPGQMPHTQLPGFFRGADLYVSCVSNDGSSVSLLEAMASGLPVVVTDVPGNREWVETEKNGWLAPAGDSERFAQAMQKAADSPPSRLKRMGALNRQNARKRADWDRNFPQLLRAYARLERRHA